MKAKLHSFILYLFIGLLSISTLSQELIGDPINGEAEGDRLGRRRSIALSSNGNIVALGAYENDANGPFSGHVRVFENIDNDWVQLGEDIDGSEANIGLGFSTSLSDDGTILAVGAANSIVFPQGFARVYQNNNGTWQQIGDDIFGEDTYGGFFGGDISLSSNGNILAVGDFMNNENGNNSGHVRVYENNGGTWVQIGDDIDGEAEEEKFGRSVSLSSNGAIVAVGATGLDSGLTRIFENNNGSWVQIGDDILGEAQGDSSGFDVSLSSDGITIAIGAPENDGNGLNSGHVRVFEYINGAWEQIGNDIDGEASVNFSGFAISLSADGNVVAIGAYGNESSKGHVRIYQNNNDSWLQLGTDIDGENIGENLGRGVDLSDDGSTVACGVWSSDANGTLSGQVRVYDLSAVLSTNEFSLSGFKLYPNPTSNALYIEASNTLTSIEIYNLLGQQILSSKPNTLTEEIDMSGFNSGMYLVKVTIGEQSETYKVLKQ